MKSFALVINRVARRILRRPSPPPPLRVTEEWAIGIYEGRSPCHLSPAAGLSNPVITRTAVSDAQAAFVADPFMLRVAGTWFMFFEVLNCRTRRGEIGLATSADGWRWAYNSIVLREPFHVSYPYVFEWAGEYFMVPESTRGGGVRLYRAQRFPWQWKFVGVLLEGPRLVDASLFRRDGRWWMFVETSPAFACETLRLYSADALEGRWCEHPASPIVAADPHTARPAGRVVVEAGGIIRFAQDCQPRYGLSVTAFEVLELTPKTYRERKLSADPLLRGSGSGWNRDGMHHIDPHALDDGNWIACVDGWVSTGALNP